MALCTKFVAISYEGVLKNRKQFNAMDKYLPIVLGEGGGYVTNVTLQGGLQKQRDGWCRWCWWSTCDDEVDGEWALQLLGLLLNHECTNSVNECSQSFSPFKHPCEVHLFDLFYINRRFSKKQHRSVKEDSVFLPVWLIPGDFSVRSLGIFGSGLFDSGSSVWRIRFEHRLARPSLETREGGGTYLAMLFHMTDESLDWRQLQREERGAQKIGERLNVTSWVMALEKKEHFFVFKRNVLVICIYSQFGTNATHNQCALMLLSNYLIIDPSLLLNHPLLWAWLPEIKSVKFQIHSIMDKCKILASPRRNPSGKL